MNNTSAKGDFEHELVHEWIYRRLDNSLSAETRLHLDQHLERCAECRAFEDQVRLLDRRLRVEMPLLGAEHQAVGQVAPINGSWLGVQWQQRVSAQARIRSFGLLLAGLVAVIGLFSFLSRPENRAPGPAPSFNDLNSTQTVIAGWPTATLAATQTPRATPLPHSAGRLLYEASDNRSTDLYLTRADASGRMILGPHPNSERAPHPSPDFQKVAFLSNRLNFGQFEIYLINADGSGARMLTEIGTSAGRGWTGEMAWSPDSRQLVAVYDPADPAITFSVVRGDSSDPSRQYDGQWEGQLYQIDLESGTMAALTPPDLLAWAPTWSPDGSRIYFNALRDGYTRIYSIRADGSDLQLAGQTEGRMEQAGFTFSPDGQRLAYLALRRTRGTTRDDEIHVLDLVSGVDRIVWKIPNTAEIDLPLAARFSSMYWSPDGQHLAYAIPGPDGKAVLKMLDLAVDPDQPAALRADTQTVLFVGIDLYFPGHYPVWSLDSRSMAILTQRQVYVISAHSDVDSTGGGDLVEIYTGKRDEIGAGWLSWLP